MPVCTRFGSVRLLLLAVIMCAAASGVHAAVPSPWLAQDVGAPLPAGTSTYNAGTFTITASGADIWGTSDQFHFVYQQMSGDIDVAARVDSLVATHAWAKAGIMFRTSLSATSADALVGVTGSSGVTFLHRDASGGSSVSDPPQTGSAPRWVRLVRSGSTITAYHGADGAQWTKINSITLPLGTSIYVGLAVSSHTSGVLTTALMSNVSIKSAAAGGVPAPQTAADIGTPAIVGGTTYASGQYTINAGGIDIWNTSDQFHYVYQPLSGDGEVIARVSSLGASSDWAKAGVMVRETLAADSRHADVMITSANGYTFQRRIDPAGTTVSNTGFSGAAPGWVRLVRSGYTFTAYKSTDGTTWTLLGTDTVPMTDPVYVGIAVTSHNAAAGTTAVVDNFTVKTATSTNQPPTVSVTAPSNGSSFTAPATISLSATASDPENRLSHVDFYAGTTMIVSDTAAPFTATWSSVPAGTYSLTAVAYDADGGKTTSAAVTVTVTGTTTNQPPTVTLTSPVSGSTATAPATLTLSANASDPEGRLARVEFYSGTTLLNSDTTSPFSYTWSSVAAGTYAIKAIAYDADGGTTSSSVATVTVSGGTSTPITFVQSAYAVPQSTQTTVSVAYPNAQNAGDLNVLAIGWSDSTRQVLSVTDTRGNTYKAAAAPTVNSGVQSQVIYYAANIAAATAGANSVTVTFDGAANFPDVRIAEYRGVATTNPVEAAAGASGSGGTSSAGPIVTSNANDLIIAANDVQSTTAQPGSGFASRVITSPDGNILEDLVTTAAGSYTASASLNGTMGWVMQVVAFRGASSTPPPADTQPPTAPTGLTAGASAPTQMNVSWTAATDNVGVASYMIERCQGSGCTSFAQVGTSNTTSYSVSGLSASTSYSYRVRATDAAGNLGTYSNVATASTPSSADTQPPTAPSGLNATAASSSQINLTWTAATDNIGVTGYLVERCQGSGCTTFAQVGTPTANSFSDSGLAASTSYTYRVRAKDAAGNVGANSSTANATTQAASSTRQVAFTASADHSTTMVTGYRFDVFAAGANPSTATPIATSDLGKPTPAGTGDITVDGTTFINGLAAGSYVGTVSAYGPGGTTRSTAATFTR